MRLRVLLALAAALTLAACGGGGKPAATPATKPAAPKPKTDTRRPARHAASPAAVRVIRAWSDQMRLGHVDKATSYFSVPAIVSNSGGPVTLKTRAEVRFFNLSLPCGAKLERTIAGKRYTIATFELTERVGSHCDGTGAQAATAFAFRRGKISEWRRVSVPPAGPTV